MKCLRFLFPLIFAALLLQACSTPRPWYNERMAGWDTITPPQGEPFYTLFLIGDAGKPSKEQQEPAFKLLNRQLSQVKKASSGVVWLGDNLYPVGLPDENDETRKESERRLTEQVDAVVQDAGTLVFVPGNHDWGQGAKYGYDQVRRAEVFIEKYADRGNIWLPDGGCPGPVEIPLADGIVLLAIDTQWWLHKHDKPGENGPCYVGTREKFLIQMQEAVARNQGKKVIVVAHHPLFSYGAHGGYFPASTHLFPLRMAKSNLWIPLPVLGTVAVVYRKWFGNIQDIPNKQYSQLKDGLTGIFEAHPGLVYACGHDHGLQYFPIGEQHYIVSGAGCKTRWTGHGKKADFTYTHEGFSKVVFYDNGEMWTEFWVPEGDGSSGKMVFRRKLE